MYDDDVDDGLTEYVLDTLGQDGEATAGHGGLDLELALMAGALGVLDGASRVRLTTHRGGGGSRTVTLDVTPEVRRLARELYQASRRFHAALRGRRVRRARAG